MWNILSLCGAAKRGFVVDDYRDEAVGIMGGDKMQWMAPKDRTVMDSARLLALDLLEKLSKL